jgi:iron-sulfur cluster assembly accessory protein
MSEAQTNQDLVIGLTEGAAREVKDLLAREPQGRHLRVYVEQGGCSGMQYGLTFDERRDGDAVCEQLGVPVLVDAFSANYLRGSVIDFDDSLTGGGFKLRNPNARQSCGCGKSFEA